MSDFQNTNPPETTPQTVPPPAPTPVPDYLIWAILETVLCCIPCGIVGLVYANKANTQAALGNALEAMKAAKTAKTWLIVGVSTWAALVLLYILFIAVVLIFAAASNA